MRAPTEAADSGSIAALQLTSGQWESKHSYYDISPWSPDGRDIVFSSAAPKSLTIQHRDTLASQQGGVFVMGAATLAIRQLAEGVFYNTHTGAHAMWHPDGQRVYFYRSPKVVEAVDRASGKTVAQFEGALRQFRPDGRKISWTVAARGDGRPAGMFWADEDGSHAECLASAMELHALTPNRDQFPAGDMHLKNAKWSPDGEQLLVANGVWDAPFVNRPGVARSLYLVHPASGRKRWLGYFGHHHAWAPDGRSIVYCGVEQPGGERRVWSLDCGTGEAHTVADEPLAGHPAVRPGGAAIVTEDDEGILAVRCRERRVERLARYARRFDKSHRGTHSHCAWNADGTQILYNSAETGVSQLYLLANFIA